MISNTNQIKTLLVLLLLFIVNHGKAQDKEYNILVLHSYHQGLEWTDSISAGIQEIFENRTDINIIFEYLDTKRNFDEKYYNALRELYKVKANQLSFDAIITSDNAAFDFMKTYGKEYYHDVPVLYCGVNNLDTVDILKYENFKGIGERADHIGTISSIKKIFPNRKNVLIINDNTLTGKAIKTELDGVINHFKGELNFEFISEFSISGLQKKISSLDNSYVIYLLVINRDTTGKFISYREGINHIKNASNVPIFGSWDFYKGKGLFGGKITRGRDQGKFVGKLALHIIDGALISKLKPYQFPPSTYIYDYNEMIKYNVSYEDLPNNSVLINPPPKNTLLLKILIGSTAALIVLLLILIIRLRIRRAKEAEMELIIKERTTRLNEINLQLSEIIKKKDKFFSILAHDLRGSVNIFLNFTMLLNEEDIIEDKEQSSLIRKKLQIAANQTYGLVEDLLYWGINQFTLSKNIEITVFTCQDVICNIIERFRLNLNNIRFKTDYEPGLTIESDMNICQFIFRNIIQNSVKYSNKDGEIRIKSEKTENSVIISITDDGVGMKPEVIQSIFDKKPVKKEGQKGEMSTGMGLATVLEYLEQINGKLEIDSIPHKGSTFRVILPQKNSQ